MEKHPERLKESWAVPSYIILGDWIVSRLSNIDFVVTRPPYSKMWSFIQSNGETCLFIAAIAWLVGVVYWPAKKVIQSEESSPVFPCPDRQLHQLAESDLRYLDERILIEGCIVRKQSATNQSIPWIEFDFPILNVAAFPIKIGDGSSSGRVKCLDEILDSPPEIIKGNTSAVPHGARTTVTLRQSMTRDFATKINNRPSSKLTFDFSELKNPNSQ